MTALVALATVTVLGVAVAESALAGQDRQAAERHAAVALADRLVSAESPLTRRPNVIDPQATAEVSASSLRQQFPVLGDGSIRLVLGDRELVVDGTPAGGTTIRRLVLIERTQRLTITPTFGAGNRVGLPRRTHAVELELTQPANVSITAVRANDRTVLRDTSGLRGTYRVAVPHRETVTLTFAANDTLARGDVTVTTFPRETTKSNLVVTVDD